MHASIAEQLAAKSRYLQLTKLHSMAKKEPTKEETVRYNVAQRKYKLQKRAA